MSQRYPKLAIQGNDARISKLLDQNGMVANVPDSLWNSALHACSRGVVTIGLDPCTAELVLAVNYKPSPALTRLGKYLWDMVLAGAIVHLMGAAIDETMYLECKAKSYL